MNIKLSNKVVEINIPKKLKWMKKTAIEQMKNEGVFDDSQNLEKHIDTIVKYDIPSNHYQKDVKVIGQWMSGGADSSLLAFLLCKKIKEENLDIKFQPLSVRRGRPNNPIYAGNVIDFIETELNFKMLDHKVYYPDINDEHQREIKEFTDRDTENFNQGIVDIMYSGITSNPPETDTSISKNKERNRDENSDRPLVSATTFRYFMNPFYQINKKHIKEIYDMFNLTHKLFPLTYSCEGTVEDTLTHTQHCGKCWWCEERLWAFGRLI